MATNTSNRSSRATRIGSLVSGRWHYRPDLPAAPRASVRQVTLPTPASGTPVLDDTGHAVGEVVGFVLRGGGSLTAAQVGMLRALTEAGIRPDLLVGSSAGATTPSPSPPVRTSPSSLGWRRCGWDFTAATLRRCRCGRCWPL